MKKQNMSVNKISKEIEKLQKKLEACTTREDEKAILFRYDELLIMLDEKNLNK